MGKNYSPKVFLLKAPNALLKQYLAAKGIGADLPWKHSSEKDIEPIYREIEAAPQNLYRQIGLDFSEINEMADEGGMKIFIDEARDPHHQGGADITEEIHSKKSHLEGAFWVFLNHPDVFQVAKRFQRADTLSRRYWIKRGDVPKTKADITQAGKERLEKAISEYYRLKEGRGHACHADHYARGKYLYWFCYPEDYAEGRLVYGEDQELRVETQRPAFEVIFIYCEKEGSLEVFAKGGSKTEGELQRVFGRAILEVELGDPDAAGVVYELNPLLNRSFPFPTDPKDRVADVRVKRLKLKILGRGNRRITLEIIGKGQQESVYDLLDDVLAGGRFPRDLLQLQQVSLQLVFRPDEKQHTRTLTIHVSHPHSCALKADPQGEIAKDLLKKWGIDVSGRAENSHPSRRHSVQRLLPS
jgi:hypothetical protein